MKTFRNSLFCLWFLAILVQLPQPPAFAQISNDIDEIEEPDFNKSSEEDLGSPEFTDYGEFSNEREEEAQTALFFQYGRFFGISIGVGYMGVTGNRSLLWQGGFPLIDLKLHYWFDFNFALDLGFMSGSHFYEDGTETVNVKTFALGTSLKYYFDVRDLSAAFTFSNPYILLTVGSYTKSESSLLNPEADQDAIFGFGLGFGFDFIIDPKKVYFALEARYLFLNYNDRFNTDFGPSIPNLTGGFYTVTGSILFTF